VKVFAGHVGELIVTCGLVVEQRTHHQITGEPMKFLTLADWTGMDETELFALTYRSYALAKVRYLVLEVMATMPSIILDPQQQRNSTSSEESFFISLFTASNDPPI